MLLILLLGMAVPNGDALSVSDITVSQSRMTWSNARNWCDDQGLNLLSVHSDADNDAATAACPGQCWIGLNCFERTWGEWEWVEGSSVDYTNWRDGQPNQSQYFPDRHCVMTSDGDWWGYECDDTHYALCYQVSECGSGTVEVSDFYYNGANGIWNELDGVYQGGEMVYYKEAWGRSVYLWKETEYSSDAWVMGYDYASNKYWGWRWGGNLFDSSSQWQYLDYSYRWNYDSDTAVVCGAISFNDPSYTDWNTNANSGAVEDDAIPITGTDIAPSFPDAANSSKTSFSDFWLMAASAAAIILVVSSVVMVFLKKRMQRNVAEMSSTDNVVETEMGKEANDGTVVVTTEMQSESEDGTKAVVVVAME